MNENSLGFPCKVASMHSLRRAGALLCPPGAHVGEKNQKVPAMHSGLLLSLPSLLSLKYFSKRVQQNLQLFMI